MDETPGSDDLEQILRTSQIDFGEDVRERLTRMMLEIQTAEIIAVEDGYSVSVHLRGS